jgi:hypothetical protein
MQHARIAVVPGAPNAIVQSIFEILVDRWSRSARVAGVPAEHHGLAGRACAAGFLRGILTGERFPIFQDLGPGSRTCHLDGNAMLSATEAVRRDIATGCDLVVLNAFGKLDAANSGLADAFRAAIEADVPVLTWLSPDSEAAWQGFAAPLFVTLPADLAEIDAWWQRVRPPASQSDRRMRASRTPAIR